MKKSDVEALGRGEKIKTIVTRFEEHPLTGEIKSVYLYATMWMNHDTKTANVEPIDDHPLSEDEVIAFNKENGIEGLGDYIAPPREYWQEKENDLTSERVGYDIEEEFKVLTTEPKGKTFCIRVNEGKKVEALMQWLKTKKVYFSWGEPDGASDLDRGIYFVVPSKLYQETLEFLKVDDQNIILIRQS
jgi:hypothetical protein